jgi:hypothetical protein
MNKLKISHQGVLVQQTSDMAHIRATWGDGSGEPIKARSCGSPDAMYRLATEYLRLRSPYLILTGTAIAVGNGYVFESEHTAP